MTSFNLIRGDLQQFASYSSKDVGDFSRHHLNELPWSSLEFDDLRINEYPKTDAKSELRAMLAKQYSVASENLLLSRGSEEGIDLIMRLFLEPNQDAILQFPPTFSMYAFFAQLQQAKIMNGIRDNDFQLSLASIKQSWSPVCKLIMLCRPNNPTGDMLCIESVKELCQFVKGRSIVVVDEAYIEFSGMASATELIQQFDNLIVLRTLSKSYGLAGLRVGCILSNAKIIEALERIMVPFVLPSIVIMAAIKALSNPQWFQRSVKRIVKARNQLTDQLRTLPWIEKIYASHANFLLIQTTLQQDLCGFFEQNNIAVRSFQQDPQLKQCIRISLGDETMNQRLWSLFQTFNGNETYRVGG